MITRNPHGRPGRATSASAAPDATTFPVNRESGNGTATRPAVTSPAPRSTASAAPAAAGETFTYFGTVYDITKALELTAGRISGHLDVAAWAPAVFGADSPQQVLNPLRPFSPLSVYLDADFALGNKPQWGEPDLTKPLLLCVETGPTSEPYAHLIDGHHRLYRAWHDCRNQMPATVLTAEESTQIRLNRGWFGGQPLS